MVAAAAVTIFIAMVTYQVWGSLPSTSNGSFRIEIISFLF
jgi:hypothetical protein